MQLVRAHQILSLLRNLAVARGRQKLGRYRRIEDIEQDLGNTPAKDIGRIAHQMAHKRLGHARVDGVHAHVVAVIGSPAERQLRQIARTDDKTASLVGQIHQNLRALAGLAVLVGHVLHGRIVLNVLEVLFHGRVDRNLAEAHAQVASERLGIGLGAMRRAKAGHGDRRDARTRQSQRIEGTHGHKQCQRGVQAARKADDRSLGARVGKAGLEASSLQVEDGLAALGQVAVVGRHKRRARENAVDIAGIAQNRLFGQHALKRKLNDRGLRRIVRARPRRRAAALGNQAVKIDIGHRHIAGEELRGGELRSVFIDEVLARKDHIGRGLALTRVRIGIGAVQARALVGYEAASVICLTDNLVRSRRVENHRGTGKRHLGRRGRRHPQVLADLNAQHHILGTLITAAVDKPRTHRNRTLTGKLDPYRICGRRSKPAALVELAIVGQILLGREAQKLARAAHGGAVVDILGNRNGKTDGKDNRQLASFIENMCQCSLAGMQQRAIMEQVGRGIAAQVELGQHQSTNAALDSRANSR